ncbi:MAG: flagellar hook assembly protein FlgD [Halanaerobium sp.]|nr:flagellar hook assembly protein FlgD [Halanaerobium sp.]
METNAVANTYGTGTETTRTEDSREMGKDEFLKLMIAQLSHQDPLNPLEDKEFIAQMAQFTSLEQLTNLNSSMSEFMQLQKLGQASDLIGRQVEYYVQEGQVEEGVVERVQFTRGGINLVVSNDAGEEAQFGLEQLVGIVS